MRGGMRGFIAVHAAMSAIMSTAGAAAAAASDASAVGEDDASLSDMAFARFHSKWIAPDFCFLHALSGGAWALRAFQQRGRFLERAELPGVLRRMISALVAHEATSMPNEHDVELGYQIFGPFLSEPRSWLERYGCNWQRLVEVAFGSRVPLNASLNGAGFLDMSVVDAGEDGTLPVFGHGDVTPTFRRFSYQACLARRFYPRLRGLGGVEGGQPGEFDRYSATWSYEDGAPNAPATAGADTTRVADYAVAVIDGGTGALLPPTPVRASLDELGEHDGSGHASFSLRGSRLDGVHAAALSSAALVDVLIRGTDVLNGGERGFGSLLAIDDIDSCLHPAASLADPSQLAPRLSPELPLRASEGALCDVSGLRSALAAYADTYASLPPSQAVQLVLFEDGEGIEDLATLWEEVAAFPADANVTSNSTMPSRAAGDGGATARFAVAGSVVSSAERFVGGWSTVALRTASGRISASVDARLAGRAFEVALISVRGPSGASTQRSRSNLPQTEDIPYWLRLYEHVASDVADVVGLQGVAKREGRRRSLRARQLQVAVDVDTSWDTVNSSLAAGVLPPAGQSHALEFAPFLPYRWWVRFRSGASGAATERTIGLRAFGVLLLSVVLGLGWSYFQLLPLRTLHQGLASARHAQGGGTTDPSIGGGGRSPARGEVGGMSPPRPLTAPPAARNRSRSRLGGAADEAAILREPVVPQVLDPCCQEVAASQEYQLWKARRRSSSTGISNEATFKMMSGGFALCCDVHVALFLSLCVFELRWRSLSQIVLACVALQAVLGALIAWAGMWRRPKRRTDLQVPGEAPEEDLARSGTKKSVSEVQGTAPTKAALAAEGLPMVSEASTARSAGDSDDPSRVYLALAASPAQTKLRRLPAFCVNGAAERASQEAGGTPGIYVALATHVRDRALAIISPRPYPRRTERSPKTSPKAPAVPPLPTLPPRGGTSAAVKLAGGGDSSGRGGQVSLRRVMGPLTRRRMEEEDARARMQKIQMLLARRDASGRFDQAHEFALTEGEHEAIDSEEERVLRLANYLEARAFRNARQEVRTVEERREVCNWPNNTLAPALFAGLRPHLSLTPSTIALPYSTIALLSSTIPLTPSLSTPTSSYLMFSSGACC